MGKFKLIADDAKMAEIIEKCKELLCNNRLFKLEDIERDNITLEGKFGFDYGMDSLVRVEYIMLIEEDFDLGIPDDEAEKLDCVGEVCNWLYQKIM